MNEMVVDKIWCQLAGSVRGPLRRNMRAHSRNQAWAQLSDQLIQQYKEGFR